MSYEAITERLETLRAEQEAGHQRLTELDEKRAQLTRTMLRIEGAIQVLEELVARAREPRAPASTGEPAQH